ncbi:MAG TPA: bifunctional serine/threonine-protein kinase/formylglycine-generating enzyme family protein [Bryobacteraceae bacterium]|nr:bifunctional serine/threonine-protein kinase/formylglycine-generating enzyme family protein [Bryobacteraceae bacterium]
MELPARVGKYELLEFLGGGMSHVYRARDTVIGRIVAVKILTEAGCADEEAKTRFLAEARMAGNIAHENIIAIYDFGEDEQHRPYMVMEFLRGQDMRHAIRDGRTGDVRNRLRIALELARALEYIHTQKIIHRDIKPENVHITTTGAVKLMDFGIAKTEGLSLTRAGFVLGTPYYMAPEQVLGKDVTDLVDVYAFGILLFELFTGSKPVSGDTLERIFYSIMHEPLDLEPLRKSGAPDAVVALVAKCTAKEAAQRPQGFTPVCEELGRLLAEGDPAITQSGATALPPLPPPPARKPWLMPVIGLGAVAAIAVTWLALRPGEPAGPQHPPRISTPTGEMILVPAGRFLAGKNKEPVTLPAFYIDETEVSNAAWARFAKAQGRALPPEFDTAHPENPVVRVSIMDAQSFARWAGKRLPTGREWEKAARGGDGRLYPWGSDADAARANVASNTSLPDHTMRPVKDFANGASPYGALQMVGNVWEFVDQLSTPGPLALDYFRKTLSPPPDPGEPWYTIRGVSFDRPLVDGALYDSTTVPARWRDANIGFRCAKDP